MMTEECASCRFWKDHDEKHSDLGLRHRYPPSLTFAQRDGESTGIVDGLRPQDGGWPMTFPEDWCGEWQPRMGSSENA